MTAPDPIPCPICAASPVVEPLEIAPGWHAGCYALHPFEHFIGANGNDEREAIKNWNIEVALLTQRGMGRFA